MSLTTELSADEIESFHQQGFIVLPQLAPAAEVEEMRGIFDRLFQSGTGRKQGAQFDLAGTDDDGRPAALPQILRPVEFAPELGEMTFRKSALAIAQQLLGPETVPWFEHAILKPPQYGAPTPWHQDEAHRGDLGLGYDQISIWLPLQEATEANGCMKFMAGTHRGPVLEHHSPNDDPRITALECIGDFDPAAAVLCPLPPGGATVHHCRTLHGAGPNKSDVPRRAYILAFRGPVRPDPSFQGFVWNQTKCTVAQQRRQAWKNRGGPLGRAARRAGEEARLLVKKVSARLRG